MTHSSDSAPESQFTRRRFCAVASGTTAALALPPTDAAESRAKWIPNYILGSCLYGYQSIAEVLPEVRHTGATAIDIWPKPHGNQREQLDRLGEERFAEMLETHDVTLGCITQYPLGPFGLASELRLAQRLGTPTIVTGARGPAGLSGADLKQAVRQFVERMKPHLAIAEESGVVIAIENHANSLIECPDSLQWLAELTTSKHLGIAFAPYHLPQDPELLGQLISNLGKSISMFYAWQHGMGCMKKLPKEQELLQLPGRGDLDFAPLLRALADIEYTGWTEIFMHPVPRGIPILDSVSGVTQEINRAQRHLMECDASDH